MGEINVELPNAQPYEELNRLRKITDGLRAEDAVGFQRNTGPGQYPRNDRSQKIKSPFFSLEVLSQPVKAQRERKPMIIQESQNILIQEAAVCGEGIADLDIEPC